MKLTSIGSANSTYKPNTTNVNNNKKLNFTGGGAVLDAMAGFWRMVDSGGRAAQFTVEDMFGTNLPRMYQGLVAGKQYTGEYNWKAFIQESIREILTGPTMSFFPMLALACCKKTFGPSTNIKVDNLNNLSDIMEKVKDGEKNGVRNDFFTKVVDDVLACTLDKDNAKNLEENRTVLTDALTEYSNAFNDVQKAKKKGIISEIREGKSISEAFANRKNIKLNKSKAKTKLSEETKKLTDLFEGILKRDKSSFVGVDFETLKYTMKNAKGEEKVKSMGVASYFEHAAAYVHDYVKQNTKNGIVDTSLSKIKNFKNTGTAKRVFTLCNMVILTGIVMMQIPKLYTRGKVNPNAEEIYNEAKKRDGVSQQQKEGVNNDK